MKSILVTVSDDRMGRKGGLYGKTQLEIHRLFYNKSCPDEMRFDHHYAATIIDVFKTSFGQRYKTMLSNVDPARNGRLYKPFVIAEAMDKIDYGDLLVYSDCSPEMWQGMGECWLKDCSLKRLYNIAEVNKGFATHFVRWDTRPIGPLDFGIHTHRNFTTDRCMRVMDCERFANHYQHASGTIVLIKNAHTLSFVSEWLHYNAISDCSCIGDPTIPNDYSYWDEAEDIRKMGHRHDQSVSGLIINRMGIDLINIQKCSLPHSPYLFLNLCDESVDFILHHAWRTAPTDRVMKGDILINELGHAVKVFEIWPGDNGEETYIVGFHRQSAYKTTIDKLIRLAL